MFLASLTVFKKIGAYSRFHSTAADTSTHWVPIFLLVFFTASHQLYHIVASRISYIAITFPLHYQGIVHKESFVRNLGINGSVYKNFCKLN